MLSFKLLKRVHAHEINLLLPPPPLHRHSLLLEYTPFLLVLFWIKSYFVFLKIITVKHTLIVTKISSR